MLPASCPGKHCRGDRYIMKRILNVVNFFLPVRGLILAAVCAGLIAPAGMAQQRDTRDIPAKTSSKFLAAFRDAVARASQSTVRIQSAGKQVALGTVVGPDGWIVTKASELKGAPACTLRDGR